ncbi:MAG: hypothetical protein NTV48_03455 [Candidatus Vogelbacteria bacterium]|nr:hypothetical protein [Candidatus Vogelbacteria bacterium]
MSENMLGVALSDVRGLLDDLFGRLSAEGWEIWLEQFKRFLRKEPCWTRSNRFLRQIAMGVGVIGPTAGELIFADEAELFSGGIDGDFTRWLKGVKSAPTEEAPFEVYEQVENGNFKEILEGFGVEIGRLFWTEAQAVKFAKDHGNLLHPKGWATFIPFFKKFDEGMKSERTEFFVAYVNRNDAGQLEAYVNHLSYDDVWGAENRNRFVIPQLEH